MEEKKNLRENWSNWILHLSSFIDRKKGELLIKHGFYGLGIILTIIGSEILLLLISLPSYLAASSTITQPSQNATAGEKEYHLRRKLTLGTFLTLLIIWIIKLIIILILSWSASQSTLEIKSVDKNKLDEAIVQTTAHDMLIAGIDPKLLPPKIIKVESTHKSLTIWGKTSPKDGVIFTFEELGNDALQPKVYTTWADNSGNFTLKEDTGVFSLPKGEYKVNAITYNPNTKTKSENGRVFNLEIKGSSTEWLFSSLDKILNILALLIILAGFLMTILVS